MSDKNRIIDLLPRYSDLNAIIKLLPKYDDLNKIMKLVISLQNKVDELEQRIAKIEKGEMIEE